MTTMGIPFLLEDRTGDVLNTEYDELYDRMFFGVTSAPSPSAIVSPTSPSRPSSRSVTIKIFELGSRTSSARGGLNFGRDPVVILDFATAPSSAAHGGFDVLGTILFVRQSVSMPMEKWIRKKGAGTCFACSDGETYIWTYRANNETEWTCTTSTGYVVAEYNLRTPYEPKYASSSGNVFSVYESYGHIATELLASLTIVRYMQRCNVLA
ncbi:uncharacterized protein FOMMEDRAFT_110000 [Fomitiporia mediterranea MF3/22]|uniref:uncharacterized protein n=1 Tax=Fomitiporia mediterranea (strain MF3/22) TaxID=694068 RepID=UPI0004409AF6|nr:uncharacterized protein FOMMEDRAFT_110000 [Fomitiporia mediterranea MF3/22]EJD00716.1 hypothetical protein FOMMEDRAFT_110000 [Fomitiporia mediterranea MF3/22]